MKKHLFTTLLLITLTLPVSAKGIYAFANFERSKIEVDASDTSIDKNDNGYGIGLGYTLTNHFAVEIAYRELMSIEQGATYSDYEYRINTDISALQASLVANYPLNNAVSVYGRFGVGNIDADSSVYVNDWGDITRESGSESKTRALFGVGGRYAITEQVGVRAEYSRFAKIEDTTLSSLSLALDYRF